MSFAACLAVAFLLIGVVVGLFALRELFTTNARARKNDWMNSRVEPFGFGSYSEAYDFADATSDEIHWLRSELHLMLSLLYWTAFALLTTASMLWAAP